jgi:aryl-alcohol dehydrogenase-like predicted oxidoreductase
MKKRKIGNQLVGEVGLGCMGMSFAYTHGGQNDVESVEVLNRALELGSNFWDTADMYGAGLNEKLLSGVLKDRRSEVFLATKFANVYDRTMTSHQDLVASGQTYIVDGTPEYVRKCIDASLERLGVEQIDLYYQHRVDPRTPIEETVGAMAELVKEGKVKYLGLSEAKESTIRRAHAVHPITAVQSEFSLWTRDFEHDVVPACKELGITFVPYSPLGRGFLTGEIKKYEDLAADDWRRMNPRFMGENFDLNLRMVDVVRTVAERHQVKPGQVALAWVLAQGDHLIPIPGTKRLKYLEENVESSELLLTQKDLSELSALAPPTGDRYPAASMAVVAG